MILVVYWECSECGSNAKIERWVATGNNTGGAYRKFCAKCDPSSISIFDDRPKLLQENHVTHPIQQVTERV